MAADYTTYKPMVLEKISPATLQSAEYRRFIHHAAIVSGIRLLLHRHRLRPDWPYVDTKFNPNTGRNLPASSYNMVFAWFLGRGSEALQEHAEKLGEFEELSAEERREAEDVFSRIIENMAGAIVQVTERNNGRCPFRVNRELRGIDENGQLIEADARISSAGDSFCSKGLIATGQAAWVRHGFDMLLRTVEHIREHKYGVDQFKEQPKDIGQGSRMLTLGAAALAGRKVKEGALRAKIFDVAAEFLEYILDKHYDEDSAVFSEYIDATTGERKTYLDPGHATEFVGLGMSAAACMQADKATMTPARQALLDRLYVQMPRLLSKTVELGWNPNHPGLFKAVDTQTRQPINDDMPWWNLPETMRAAAYCLRISRDTATKDRCLEILRMCHNAYFTQYPNPANMLFPFQTISGTTGKVVDKVPAVPEGDPLYHTNLALLEMLDVIGTAG